MKAKLRYYEKARIKNRYIVELSIYEVGELIRYPDKIKYALICKDLISGEYVLFDNHHPKGPHMHINDTEFPYHFIDENKLIKDFRKTVQKVLEVRL